MSKKDKPFRPPLLEPEIKDSYLWDLARDLASGTSHACDRLMADLGSPPPVLTWNPERTELPHPEFAQLLDWWDEARGPRPAPEPKQIDPTMLARSLGHLVLNEVIDDGQDFRVRLFGSKIGNTVEDMTGKNLSRVWTPMRHYFLVNYRAIVLRPQPLYSLHTPALNININAWDRLILPIMEEDRVTRILTSIYATDRQEID